MEQYVTAAYANVHNVREHMELVDDGCEGALGNTGSWCLGRSISIKYSHSLNGLGEILTRTAILLDDIVKSNIANPFDRCSAARGESSGSERTHVCVERDRVTGKDTQVLRCKRFLRLFDATDEKELLMETKEDEVVMPFILHGLYSRSHRDTE